MVSDGDSGFAFQPELGKPEDSTGQLLARALLGAMRDGRFVPSEVRVRHKEFKILLSELSERIGFGVRVTKSLPALDHLKDHFLAMVGTLEKFRTGRNPFAMPVLISTFESCSAYARVVTLPESIPVRYTEEDAGYVTVRPIVKQTFRLDELLDMILSVTGKDAARIRQILHSGRLSIIFTAIRGRDLTRTMRSCPLPWRDFRTPILRAHSTQTNARWPFLNLQARTPSTYWN